MKDGNVMVQCRFDLTDSEVAAAARKRATIEVEIARIDSAFKVEHEKHKKALGTLEGQAGALADLIRKGYELRDTECRIEFDYDKGEVCTVRVDRGEVVKTRPMTEGERAKGPLLPLGPAIALDESDPDAQAAKDCSSCGHLRVYHEPQGCIQPDCGCYAFTAGPSEEAPAEGPKPAPKRHRANADDVCLCGDLRSEHRDGTGCDTCDCTEFRDSDPLGIAHVEPEKREAEL